MRRTSLAVLIALIGESAAVQYRPYTDGRTPWYKKYPREPKDEFPVNYAVPNFGEDQDIVASKEHTAAAEKALGHEWTGATFKKPKGHPVDYFVPNFGVDHDIQQTHDNLSEAESQIGHHWEHASFKAPKSHPVDYFVPNFGQDKDVESTLDSASGAEKSLNHKWVNAAAKPPAPPPRDYFVPNFGVDQDIKTSLKNTEESEKALGHTFSGELVQTASDPVCSSAGCTQYKHAHKKLPYPVDYPVANHGEDPEIQASIDNEKLASEMVPHKWEFGTKASAAKWENPAKKVLYDDSPKLDRDMRDSATNLRSSEDRLNHKFMVNEDIQTMNEIHSESDPICSSAGCT